MTNGCLGGMVKNNGLPAGWAPSFKMHSSSRAKLPWQDKGANTAQTYKRDHARETAVKDRLGAL